MIVRNWWIGCCLLLVMMTSGAWAQDDDWDYQESSIVPVLGGFAQFNSEDVALGVKLGIGIPRSGLAIMAVWHQRPYKKVIQQRVSSNSLFQYKENRGLVGIQVAKRIPLFRQLDFTVAGGMGYSYADFAGTSREPDKGATALFEAGFTRFWGPLGITLGYQFINWPDVPRHRAHTGINLWF